MNNSTLPKTFKDLAFYWLVTYAQSHKAASSINRDKGILRNYLLPRFGQMLFNEIRAMSERGDVDYQSGYRTNHVQEKRQ